MTIDQLHQTYQEQLQRYASRLARDRDLADDLVQETFVRVLGHLDLMDQLNRSQRRAWLYQTLKRLFLDRRAAQLRQASFVERFTPEVDHAVAADDSGGFDLFQLVPAGDRELVEKRYRQGLNSYQIAAQLGIPPATVRTRLHQAVKRLRAKKERFI
ncbi:MAG: sigma-70 family RNA polymerase sigma factor [Candidatus Latescibacteria bacterium]|nr:sigma-70 family RNA polymerase sigma factor [Candidatus Latescibacterota bacterium]